MDTSRRRKFAAEEWERFLHSRPKTVLATINANGTPHMTPVGFLYEDGAFKMTTTTDRVKYRNIARDARVSLIIRGQVNERDGEGVVVVSGAVEVDLSRKAALDVLGRIVGEGHTPEMARQLYKDRKNEPRVLLTLRPSKTMAWVQIGRSAVR
ncbi:MAG: hypothetical protein EXR49_05360 [Dehalococcoidia bacterium]|nr:hypothetical protein [Dehalococcoidia bacterium]